MANNLTCICGHSADAHALNWCQMDKCHCHQFRITEAAQALLVAKAKAWDKVVEAYRAELDLSNRKDIALDAWPVMRAVRDTLREMEPQP